MPKSTASQSSTETLADLLRALDGKFAVTISYVKPSGTESVRTIDIHDVHTTQDGQILIRAWERFPGQIRDFHPERIRSYTLHRGMSFAMVAPPAALAGPKPVLRSVAQVIALELGRDYWSPKPPVQAS